MRWWGWGSPEHPQVLGPGALEVLHKTIDLPGLPAPPVALSSVTLEPSQLSGSDAAGLRRILGEGGVRADHFERVLHAGGKGYLDLVRLRAGRPGAAPDAVLHPSDTAEVEKVLEHCASRGLAVVPFSGGTSVVGGLAPIRGTHRAVVSLDLSALGGMPDLDGDSMVVRAGAGTGLAALEGWLAVRGLTLGHFPQSFEHVTIGGCAATRSAGQASTGYGRFDEMVVGLELATPTGTISTIAVPASAAGPDLRELALGSEGALGVISELSLRVRRRPEASAYAGFMFSDFQSGTRALQGLAQDGPTPTVARLSDMNDTRVSLALAGGGVARTLGSLYLGVRGYREGCLAIVGFEGDGESVRRKARAARAAMRRHGAIALGAGAGRAWVDSRFTTPYVRDDLLTQGVMVETLESAALWAGIERVHAAVQGAVEQALRSCGTPGLVGCHISHIYTTGACLYFTLLAPGARGREEAQWRAVKRAAGDAIAAERATITHHHGIGADHLPWMDAEVGATGLRALRALKAELDPAGVMNPGKLVPVPQEGAPQPASPLPG